MADLSFVARRGGHHLRDRPERRGQDDGVQLHHRVLPPVRGRAAPDPPGRRRLCAAAPAGHKIARRAPRPPRTFQNIRLFAGMTVLGEPARRAAQRLMPNVGMGLRAVFGIGGHRRVEAAAIAAPASGWTRSA
ncbi:MAG: hypothetical protein WDN49_03825 [Acetobacteraceae bacterium]